MKKCELSYLLLVDILLGFIFLASLVFIIFILPILLFILIPDF
jgi:hypothetical protein